MSSRLVEASKDTGRVFLAGAAGAIAYDAVTSLGAPPWLFYLVLLVLILLLAVIVRRAASANDSDTLPDT